ncbi:unnamed protein product [Clonostachys rosea]|uniref:Nucleoside phosphorylase domain-containing protein n=1 Tax=Bionectria ochroleuca TaxID=29856 RepID=A0ABY6TTR0_BIOOC|nr:unnamed protein product [Clonostachys rosea]
MASLRPQRREDFEIGIICALPLEYNAVSLLFDEFWDEDGDSYGKATGDFNNYTTGRIGKYNVVLALLSHMGKSNAASAAAGIRSSYCQLRLALLVGVCGGVPRVNDDEDEILLGDVVISKTVVQFDFGRQYPDRFIPKDAFEDRLGKQNKDVRSFLIALETDRGLERLERRTAHLLKQLQANSMTRKRRRKYGYPGTAEDRLFEPTYRHKHHISPTCICSQCYEKSDPVCDDALKSSCRDLGCEETYLVTRERLQMKSQLEQDNNDEAQEPAIHVGVIISGDTVMKSGEDRDAIAKREGAIAFEMEGVGVWEELPCLIIKGVCDYADCHKNKKWQDFAAATAASAAKALLEAHIQTDKSKGTVTQEVGNGGPDNQPSILRNTASQNSEQTNEISQPATGATARISDNSASGGSRQTNSITVR